MVGPHEQLLSLSSTSYVSVVVFHSPATNN